MPETKTEEIEDITVLTPGNNKSSGNANNNLQSKKGLIAVLKNLLNQKKSDDKLRDAIDELITDSNNTDDENMSVSIAEHERTLITNILDLRDMAVIDIMVPRADINALDVNTSFDDLVAVLTEKPHSRFPVYEGDLDNVIGSIHMKDVIKLAMDKEKYSIKDITRNVLVVSPSMRVMDLLLQMRQSRLHLAMVVDEFGGIDGLITINDLIEAIVGEIEDEHNFEVQPRLIERVDGTIIADARFEMDDFKERYGEEIFGQDEDEDVDTLGGFVNAIAGHLPARGEIITHESGIEFEVLDADPRRINRIRIRNLPETDASPSDN